MQFKMTIISSRKSSSKGPSPNNLNPSGFHLPHKSPPESQEINDSSLMLTVDTQ
jgi:hypothetical protein